MKYIVFADNSAVIFPETTSHKFVAGDKLVISAGFCKIETYRNNFDDIRANVCVWGESTTLNVKSNPDDAKIIERIFV